MIDADDGGGLTDRSDGIGGANGDGVSVDGDAGESELASGGIDCDPGGIDVDRVICAIKDLRNREGLGSGSERCRHRGGEGGVHREGGGIGGRAGDGDGFVNPNRYVSSTCFAVEIGGGDDCDIGIDRNGGRDRDDSGVGIESYSSGKGVRHR